MTEVNKQRLFFDKSFLKDFWEMLETPGVLGGTKGICTVRARGACPYDEADTICCGCPVCVDHFSAIGRDIVRRCSGVRMMEISPKYAGDKGLQFVWGDRRIILLGGAANGTYAAVITRKS